MGLREHRPDGCAEGGCRVVHGHHDRHQGHSASPCQSRNDDGPFKHRSRVGAATQIVVAGQGRVGLPLAVRAAEVGHRVVGCDVDPHRDQQLTAGQSYVEDVASSRLRAVRTLGPASRPPAPPRRQPGGRAVAARRPPSGPPARGRRACRGRGGAWWGRARAVPPAPGSGPVLRPPWPTNGIRV
ncbi:hypothetical protein [Streptomyces echinatus]|uniref:hypothetical protein n=1 Tax=Streptomyces echinatus TaxID=67293 RepID=UPI003809F2FA